MSARRHPTLRLLLPAALAAVGVYGLLGCVYIPLIGGRPVAPDGRDVRDVVGPADSGRPVRPGVTRAAVFAYLGPPSYRTVGDEAVAYEYTLVTGRWFGLCVRERDGAGDMLTAILTRPTRASQSYLLMLRFDPAGGQLVRYELAGRESIYLMTERWNAFAAGPNDPRRSGARDDLPGTVPATGPESTPASRPTPCP